MMERYSKYMLRQRYTGSIFTQVIIQLRHIYIYTNVTCLYTATAMKQGIVVNFTTFDTTLHTQLNDIYRVSQKKVPTFENS